MTQSEIFANNLKTRRRELGLTQKTLAEMIGYSEKSVSKWESGLAIAPSAILPILAKKLETSIDSLLSDQADERYFLGIDGGGTKTAFALADKDGRIIARTTLDGCNPVDVGIERTLEILTSGIAEVASDIPNSKISVFAGISGGITGTHKEKIHAFLEKYNFACAKNGSDAESAVALTLGGGEGTAIIMGTGSIAFTRLDGQLIRNGGWGYLFDEGGSGYAIGRDAVMAALKAEEGRTEETALLPILKEKLGTRSLIGALGTLYDGGKRLVASFAPCVFEAFAKADATAAAILSDNMRSIAEIISAAPKSNTGKWRVVLVGGLANDADILVPMIEKHLKNKENYQILANTRAPICGALLLAGADEIKED